MEKAAFVVSEIVKAILMAQFGLLPSSQVKRTPPRFHNEFIIRKLNPLVVVDFRFISAFLMSREFTRETVTKFLPAKFP